MSEEEVNAGLREQAAERRRKALARVETLDLSQTTWPELPHPRIVNTITFVALRGLNRYPHLRGTDLRNELAERHDIDPAPPDPRQRRRRAAELGHPRADRARPAAAHLLALLPAVSDHGPPRPRPRGARHRAGSTRCSRPPASPSTRVVALASPNDPTGELLAASRAASGCSRGCPTASRCCSTSRSSSSPTPSRPTPRSKLLEDHRGCSSSAASPRPGDWPACASATRSAGPARRTCWPSWSPTSASREVSQAGALEALRSCSELLAERVRRDRARSACG